MADLRHPARDRRQTWKGKFRGQTQKWYALRFTGKDSEIDIAHPAGGHKPEFPDWRWEAMEKLPALIIPFKRPVYERVVEEFRKVCEGVDQAVENTGGYRFRNPTSSLNRITSIQTRSPISVRCGTWPACGAQNKGLDINPKADGPERRVFIETVRMDPIDPSDQWSAALLRSSLSRSHQYSRKRTSPFTTRSAIGSGSPRPEVIHADPWPCLSGQVLLALGQVAPGPRRSANSSWKAKRGGHPLRHLLDGIPGGRNDGPTAIASTSTCNEDGSWTYVTRTHARGRRRQQPSITTTPTR